MRLHPVSGERAPHATQPYSNNVGGRRTRLTSRTLLDVISRMRADPTGEFQTEAAAAQYGVPSPVFIRAFKALTGISPQRFRAALRIELAKRLLVETDQPVTDICFDVGYNSLGTFVRTFSWLVGVSPGQLRRLARGEGVEDFLHGIIVPGRSDTPRLRADLELRTPERIIAAGLFPQRIPTGLPFDGCIVDPKSRNFSLAWPAGRSHASLLAASLNPERVDDVWAGPVGEIFVSSINVARSDLSRPAIRLRFRRLSQSDPPFLTPIPLLMFIERHRSCSPM